jgi:hypothetical protein
MRTVKFSLSSSIGLFTGLLGLGSSYINSNLLSVLGFEDTMLSGFCIGFLIGFSVASILMSVVWSSLNTVNICYAVGTTSFQTNHPELAAELRQGWVDAWPYLRMD